MANRTDAGAKQIHGMNPQFLLEKILRNKIYNTIYWKEKCFALTSETIIDSAVDLKYIGGTYGGNNHPTDFICLILKMLQIQPNNEILNEYLSDDSADYKYLRALAAFYVRLTCKNDLVYRKLEPLYNDYRKLRIRNLDGSYSILHMDEYIEELLSKESLFDVTFPILTKRKILEQNGELESRISLLEADLDLEKDLLELNEVKNYNYDEENLNVNIDVNDEDSSESSDDKSVRKNDNDLSRDDNEISTKKQKVENRTEEEITMESIRNLDPESKEYWLAMRKIVGIK